MPPDGLACAAVDHIGPGWRVGHWTDPGGLTGCTVLLPPAGNVASYDIRGSSPSTRELALLHTDRKLTEIHGLLFTGGSAFGLDAASGVVAWLEDHGRGYKTRSTLVPIVPAAVILDGGAARRDSRPTAAAGRAACDAAQERSIARGRVGAGTGATVGKWAGLEFSAPGGLGLATAGVGGLSATALAVVNAVGDVMDDDGRVIAGSRAPEPRPLFPRPPAPEVPSATVLVALAVHGSLDKRDVRWLAARGSDGVTRAVRPAHTRYDGDVAFAIAAPGPATPDDLDVLGLLATEAVAAAVRDAVTAPETAGVPVTPPR